MEGMLSRRAFTKGFHGRMASVSMQSTDQEDLIQTKIFKHLAPHKIGLAKLRRHCSLFGV